jgi:galactokinase
VLRELDEEVFMTRLPDLRKAAGDRAVLRALHFFNENRRVDFMLAALENLNALPSKSPLETKKRAMETFLALVRESGDSSSELLQNIYSTKNPAEQGLTLALALTKNFLGPEGACRVHGGGFAGTIQAYIPIDKLGEYRSLVESVFGTAALAVLRVRPLGAIELNFRE